MISRAKVIFSTCFSLFLFSSLKAELVWDKKSIESEASHETRVLILRFPFSNSETAPVFINEIKTSCGCVEPLAPELPWAIVPGVAEELEVKVNIRGKKGTFQQSLEVLTQDKTTELLIKVEIEDPVHRPMTVEERNGNLAKSKADRQAIFKGNCIECHVKPTHRKYGMTLYESACGICHDSKQRASVVPDLKDKIKNESPEYWRQWITKGKVDGLMPGFAASEGGPLSGSQVSTLINHIARMKREHPDNK